MRKNPFHAFAKFKGRAARLRAWEGGFHTAKHKDLTIPYAQMKWDNDPDDYPVILTFAMGGMRAFADIDSRRAAEMFYVHCKVAQYRVGREDADPDQILESLAFDTAEESSEEWPNQPGAEALNSMWKLSDSPSVRLNALRQAVQYIGSSGLKLERMYALGEAIAKDERVLLDDRDEKMLIEAFGQCRYLTDVPDERLIKVEYMAPFFAQVIDPDGDEDEVIDEAAEAGYSFVESVQYELDESRTTAWERKVSELPLFGNKADYRVYADNGPFKPRIEYHGTSLKNLLTAAPWLAELLPEEVPSPCISTVDQIIETLKAEGKIVEDEDEE
jgi:hypothetical protein